MKSPTNRTPNRTRKTNALDAAGRCGAEPCNRVRNTALWPLRHLRPIRIHCSDTGMTNSPSAGCHR